MSNRGLSKSDVELLRQIEDTQSFLLECKWTHAGQDIFSAMAEYLAETLGMDYVCIDSLLDDGLEAQTVAIYFDGKFEDNVQYTLKDTPCGEVVEHAICCFPSKVRNLFPKDLVLQEMLAESYVGLTLRDSAGNPIGLIAVIGRKPLTNKWLTEFILKQVSIRAAGELEHMKIEENLRQSEQRLSFHFENSPLAVVEWDSSFIVRKWSIEAENIFGWRKEDTIGKRIDTLNLIYHEDIPVVDHTMERLMSGAELNVVRSNRNIKKSGEIIDAVWYNSVLLDNNGRMLSVVSLVQDITQRKIAEKALTDLNEELDERIKERTAELEKSNQLIKIAEEKYRTVADYTYNWESWLDPSGKFIYVSPSCYSITGYTVEEYMNDPFLVIKIVHPDDRRIFENHFNEDLKGNTTIGSLDYRIITRNGEERWIGHSCRPIFNEAGIWIGQRSSNRDISNQKKTEKLMMDTQQQLRALTVRMDAIAEDERTRIAREIHDELGHLLTALKFDVESIVDKSELDPVQVKDELTEIISMIDALIDSVRKISTDLRPGILDHLGLVAAIEWQISQFQMRTKINCNCVLDELNTTLNKNETTIIYRILQEILTNVVRHSKANNLWVLLRITEDSLTLKVKDDGVGFEWKDYLQVNYLGLMGMRERALSIGGEIIMESVIGKGTTVTFLLNLKE